MFAGEATNAALNENRSEFIETLRPIAERTVGEGKGRSGWYHWSCFFAEHCPASVDDIRDFEVLSWVDRRRIRERIEFLVDCANADTGICHLCQDRIPEVSQCDAEMSSPPSLQANTPPVLDSLYLFRF
ncbi:unnamed protein product, partial [Timema podura]|nr:unnamed protein product [Timema podura]